MTRPRLTSLDFGEFKSYQGQRFPIEPLTLLIGRNGSGKSNALDALAMLALLADGRDLSDLERGDQEVAGLRGGLSGAAPFGQGLVAVGAAFELTEGESARLDLVLDPQTSEVKRETLTYAEGNRAPRTLIDAHRTGAGSGLAEAQIYSGGAPKTVTFLSGRLAVAQAPARVPADTKSRQLVLRVAAEVVSILTGIVVLDPVPARMREYSRVGTAPDRSGASLSAQMFELRKDEDAWDRLTELVKGMVGANVEKIDFATGRVNLDVSPTDVMVALVENAGGRQFPVLATNMSDGTLRYIAILTTLLSPAPRGSVPVEDSSVRRRPRTLVVEEIENGLFPDQASRILQLLRTEAAKGDLTFIATTHSPSLLDALKPDDHAGVVITERDAEGRGTLVPLVEHPKYVRLAETGRLGTSLSEGALTDPTPDHAPLSLEDLLS